MSDDFDEEIAPLVLMLWQMNIIIIDGCQEADSGWAFLEFMTSIDLENFLDMASIPDVSPDSIHSRIENSEHLKSWDIDIQASDFGHENPKYSNYHVHVFLRFPRLDIQEIYNMIKSRIDDIHSKTKENDPALN